MKYFIRILAIIPAFCVGITALLLLVSAIDYHWLVIPAIGNILAFTILMDNYEHTVIELRDFIRILADKTLCDELPR